MKKQKNIVSMVVIHSPPIYTFIPMSSESNEKFSFPLSLNFCLFLYLWKGRGEGTFLASGLGWWLCQMFILDWTHLLLQHTHLWMHLVAICLVCSMICAVYAVLILLLESWGLFPLDGALGLCLDMHMKLSNVYLQQKRKSSYTSLYSLFSNQRFL